jgi:hypothetical protein
VSPPLGIQLAPPVVGGVAWLGLTSGPPDVPAQVLFGYGLFQGLVLLRLAPWFRAQGFTVGLWAFTFGITAIASMALRMLERGGQGPPALLALPLFVFANAFVGYLAVRTLLLARTGRLLSADCPATAVTRGPRAVGCGAVLAQACGDYVADDPCACVVIRRAKGSSSPALRSRPAAPIDVSSGRSRLPRFRCVGPDFPESRARPSKGPASGRPSEKPNRSDPCSSSSRPPSGSPSARSS